MNEPEKNFTNVTPRVLQAFKFGRDEAKRRGQDCTSEHLLLGMIMLGSGVAFTMLKKLDVDRAALSQTLDCRPPTQDRDRTEDEIGRLLAFADATAKRCKHKQIGTEHLFFSIVSDEAASATRMLRDLGIEPTTLRDELMTEFFE